MGSLERIIAAAKKRSGKRSRKWGRQYRYWGLNHSQTLYRSRNQREKNKARRAAQRSRKLQRLKDKRNGIYLKEHGTEEAANLA